MSHEWIYYGALALTTVPILGISIMFCVSWFTPWPRRSKSFFFNERYHYNQNNAKKALFPNILSQSTSTWKGPQHTKPELYLTVVIPAMNEEERLPKMLDECLAYLCSRNKDDSNFTYEVIIVDDGSSDETTEIAMEYASYAPLFVCRLPQNLGKGGAVRVGVLCARGKLILFADADGATKFDELYKLEVEMRALCNGVACRNDPIDWTHPAIVVGSRAHLRSESIATRSFLRTILMIGFHLLVRTFAVSGIHDTQCGFKLFTRAAAAKLFPQMHIERWAFDVELLYLAEMLNFSMAEVPVHWTEVDGSKITPIFSWIQMGRDILLIWFRYMLKIWRINEFKD